MTSRLAMLSAVLLGSGAETYYAACVAFDPVARAAYVSDPFQQSCGGDVAACRRTVEGEWASFLGKQGLAQGAGATRQCELQKDGSTPDETPRARVRKWRDEIVARTQQETGKVDRVVATSFRFD